jgi:hypothetical protein
MQRIKRDYANKVFNILAESKEPLSPFDIQKNWKNKLKNLSPSDFVDEQEQSNPPYSRIYEAITKLRLAGYVELNRTEERASKKNNKITFYGLTFKGVLKYLSQFYEKSRQEEFSQSAEKFLALIENQGNLINYPLFQECRWLYERNKRTIHFFIREAYTQLSKPLECMTQIAEEFSKHIGDPNYEPNYNIGTEDVLFFRSLEDDDLRFAFGENYLMHGLRPIAEDSLYPNAKLYVFAKHILDSNLEKIMSLESAARLFEQKVLE